MSDEEGYWQERLAAAAPVELATGRLRRRGPGHRYGTEQTVLPGDAGVLLSQVTGGRPLAALLTAWAAVLHRHTAKTDLLIGVDTRLTHRPPNHGLLPVCVAVDPSSSFADSLDAVQAALAAAVRHAPELTRYEPDWSWLVRAAIITEDGPSSPDAELGLILGTADLTLRYDVSRYDRTTAAWLAEHCATLLAAAVRDPARPLRSLPVLADSPAVPPWRFPTPEGVVLAAPLAATESLVDRWRSVVAEHGERVAVLGASGTYRYAELDSITTAIAHRLHGAIAAGSRIALLCGHDVGVAVGVWSALKAGLAYVPLDPRQPNGRLARLIAEADVSAIACDRALAGRAAKLIKGRPVIALDPVGPADAAAAALPPVGPEAPAYLLYTSGSTGRPKAVVQTHRNVLAHAVSYARRVRIGGNDRVPLLARFTFDGAVMDLFGALLSGAGLCVIDPLVPAADLRARLTDIGATVVHCTPTLFRHLVGDAVRAPASGVEPFGAVRAVVLGGEEATCEDLRRFLDVFPPGAALVNGFGPTECTMALQHLASRADVDATTLPIGHPVDGVSVRLLDADGEPTEIFGELELLGDRAAQGYFRQPEATVAAFGVYPDGTRYYRTGDLARCRPDGAFVFQGRKDRQMKVRGHRIEPGEVEAALCRHPTVAQAAVTVAECAGRPTLVGYVTPATAFPADPDELYDYLRRILPDYAVPAHIVALDGLPLGPTGKLDRARLPAPEEAADPHHDSQATPSEQAVARIWQAVLGAAPAAGPRTSFLLSGGDSIKLLELISAIRVEFDVDVPMAEFLRAPTLATLAALTDAANGGGGAGSA